jgi:hypothetical protein
MCNKDDEKLKLHVTASFKILFTFPHVFNLNFIAHVTQLMCDPAGHALH